MTRVCVPSRGPDDWRHLPTTIALAEWRIATYLAGTRAIQHLPTLPATGCTCAWCRNWARVRDQILPPPLREELRRLGIDPGYPTDLYAFGESGEVVHFRVTYHCVGHILSGPSLWGEDPNMGRTRRYIDARGDRPWLGLSVAYQEALHEPAPWYSAGDEGQLIQIDFRLEVPWVLAEPRPAVTAG